MVEKGRIEARKVAEEVQIRPLEKQDKEDQRVSTKYHNQYIKSVVRNVDQALSYRPGVDVKPCFAEATDSAYSAKVKE